MKKHDGSGFALVGLGCLLAHFTGWLGFAVVLLVTGAAMRVRQWLRGPYEAPQPGMDTTQATRVGHEMGRTLGEIILNATRARRETTH